jgi:hypothetical protein
MSRLYVLKSCHHTILQSAMYVCWLLSLLFGWFIGSLARCLLGDNILKSVFQAIITSNMSVGEFESHDTKQDSNIITYLFTSYYFRVILHG